MPAEKQKLKPCPFCGSKDVGIYGNETDHFYVSCMNPVCFCNVGKMYSSCDEPDHMFGDDESAAYNWNQRAEQGVVTPSTSANPQSMPCCPNCKDNFSVVPYCNCCESTVIVK